ncbi:hypothetical protein [Streptomyces sp. NRRL S-455]|uniref:hypothetical protein n=1 Tax=Streptomyces sp. NRRL S-455 TaxID=1463908 RepID=UPI00131A4CE1|nr:hypothetical protein [Streptomyces sp. NRRL S-455]
MSNAVTGQPQPAVGRNQPSGDQLPYVPPWDNIPRPTPWWPWCDRLPWIIRSVTREMDLFKTAPPEVQKKHFEVTLNGLKEDGILEEGDVQTLLSAFDGARADIPPAVTPDGSPSLCGMIGATLVPRLNIERSGNDVGVAGGAAVGAAAGAGVGGTAGAIAGASLGALVASSVLPK